jgi:hypothetical protein
MSTTLARAPLRRHPWLDRFLQSPVDAVGDLLAGYAEVSPYQRADAPDIADMVFGPLPPDDVARLALEPALLAWLEARRRMPVPAEFGPRQRFVREVSDAFAVVAMLELADTARRLRQEFVRWDEWTARLVLAPARDARAAFWLMLALTQPLLGEAGARLEPFWLRVCRESGAALEARYLDIGLLGLRCLPYGKTRTEEPWLAGLAYWALARQPDDGAFRAEWFALKPLYPRAARSWRELVHNLLKAPAFRDAGIEAPAWWRVDRDFAPILRADQAPKHASARSPMPEDAYRVIDAFGQPFAEVEPLVAALMQQHRRFRDPTGEGRYFVRAAHVMGKALIERSGDMPAHRARLAARLAREGLDWAPGDRFLGALWRDALAAQGALEAAEFVGWDHVRRDPDNADGRTQLATLLAERLGRAGEAEALLRDAIARFPDNAVARAQLAELLIDHGRSDEVESVVADAFAGGAVDAATYALRARLLSHAGRDTEARATVAEGLVRFQTNAVLKGYRRLLVAGRSLWLERLAAHAPPPAVSPEAALELDPDPALEAAMRHGRLRRLRFILETGDAAARAQAEDELRALLRNDPNDYAGLLVTRYRLWDVRADNLPGFALAFERALADEDRQTLEALALRHDRITALTLVARAVLGDVDAPAEVERWLCLPPGLAEPPAVVALRAGMRPMLALVESGRGVADVLAEWRAAVLRTLHDATEVMIGDAIPDAA